MISLYYGIPGQYSKPEIAKKIQWLLTGGIFKFDDIDLKASDILILTYLHWYLALGGEL